MAFSSYKVGTVGHNISAVPTELSRVCTIPKGTKAVNYYCI